MNANAQAPDIGTYSGKSGVPSLFRVDAWLRERPRAASAYDMALSGAMLDEAGGRAAVLAAEMVAEILAEEPPRKPRMEFCRREVATHVSGSGICGCIAPVTAIELVGTVNWSAEVIEEHRASAVRLAGEVVI